MGRYTSNMGREQGIKPRQDGPRGRVKNADLSPGETYHSVMTPTGVTCFKTRSLAEAEEIAARNPRKLEVETSIKR